MGVDGAAADGCGIRPDGSLECWYEENNGTVSLPSPPGVYDRIASSSGELFARDAVSGLTYLFGRWMPQTPVSDVAVSKMTLCWLDEASELGCDGPLLDPLDYPLGAVFDSIEGEAQSYHTSSSFCGFGSNSACFGPGRWADFASPPSCRSLLALRTAVLDRGLRRNGGVCRESCQLVHARESSRGSGGGGHRSGDDLWLSCRLVDDGTLDCWGSPFVFVPLPVGPFVDLADTTAVLYARNAAGSLTPSTRQTHASRPRHKKPTMWSPASTAQRAESPPRERAVAGMRR